MRSRSTIWKSRTEITTLSEFQCLVERCPKNLERKIGQQTVSRRILIENSDTGTPIDFFLPREITGIFLHRDHSTLRILFTENKRDFQNLFSNASILLFM